MNTKQLILVVDDDPDLVDSVSRKLEDNNYRTSKAYDGVEAWTKIRQERPDLVLLDVMMPEKDGYQVCAELKKDPQFKDITVVLLTAVAENVKTTKYTHHDGKTTLADDYIAKPIDLDKLVEMVRENLMH